MTTILFVIAVAFSIVFAASNMSMTSRHITSSDGGNLHKNNGDPISKLSHKPCPNGSAPDVNGKCQTTVCPNGSAPDVNGKCQTTVCPNGSAPDINGSCTRTPSRPGQPSSSLENNNSSTIVSQPSQLLPSSPPSTTCPDGSSPDTNGKCMPYPLPPI